MGITVKIYTAWSELCAIIDGWIKAWQSQTSKGLNIGNVATE